MLGPNTSSSSLSSLSSTAGLRNTTRSILETRNMSTCSARILQNLCSPFSCFPGFPVKRSNIRFMFGQHRHQIGLIPQNKGTPQEKFGWTNIVILTSNLFPCVSFFMFLCVSNVFLFCSMFQLFVLRFLQISTSLNVSQCSEFIFVHQCFFLFFEINHALYCFNLFWKLPGACISNIIVTTAGTTYTRDKLTEDSVPGT